MLTQAEATTIAHCIDLVFRDYTAEATERQPVVVENRGYVVEVYIVGYDPSTPSTVITTLEQARRWFINR